MTIQQRINMLTKLLVLTLINQCDAIRIGQMERFEAIIEKNFPL